MILVKSADLCVADIAGASVTDDGAAQDVFVPSGVTKIFLRCVGYSGSPTGVVVHAFPNCYRNH